MADKSKKKTPGDDTVDPWAPTKKHLVFFRDENTSLDDSVFDAYGSYMDRNKTKASYDACKDSYPWLARYWLSAWLYSASCRVWTEMYNANNSAKTGDREASKLADAALKAFNEYCGAKWP